MIVHSFFGVSDPFVRLTGLVGASMIWAATTTKRDTLSPTWNETFGINLLAKMPMGGKLAPFVVK
jgi:Ca2+-dependent lipid-binding protein